MNIQPYQIVEEYLGKNAAQLFEKLLSQKPERANAIVLLQGDRFDRMEKAAALFRCGYADVLLLTGNNDLIGPHIRPGESNVSLSEMVGRLKDMGVPEDSIVLDDRALHTGDQARNVVKIARARGWKSFIIVSSAYNVLRAFETFKEEAQIQHWQGTIIMQPVLLPWDQNPGGRDKTALRMLQLEMEKIKEYAQKWIIRRARSEDAKAVFEIRNDPCARGNSLRAEPIIWEDHLKWFEDHWQKAGMIFFVLEHQYDVVGYCRFVRNPEGYFEISIALSASYQGKGLGHYLLHGGVKEFFSQSLDGGELQAKVRKENKASLTLFGRHNFRIFQEDDMTYSLVLHSNAPHC